MSYGVMIFKYIDIPVEKTIYKEKKNIFGKMELKNKVVKTTRKETEDEIWRRINKTINEHKLKVTNFESIYEYRIRDHNSDYTVKHVSSKDIIGYKLFYHR